MSSYINEHKEELEVRHYLRKANGQNYYFDFTSNRINEFKERYGQNFCLVVYASNSKGEGDCYVMPYALVKHVFLEQFVDERGRWVGAISHYHEMRVGHKPNIKRMSVRSFLNNLQPLLNTANH